LDDSSLAGKNLVVDGDNHRHLKRRRWTESELGRRAKGDAGKLAIAVRLQAETVMAVARSGNCQTR
jgi:hypothetical protein